MATVRSARRAIWISRWYGIRQQYTEKVSRRRIWPERKRHRRWNLIRWKKTGRLWSTVERMKPGRRTLLRRKRHLHSRLYCSMDFRICPEHSAFHRILRPWIRKSALSWQEWSVEHSSRRHLQIRWKLYSEKIPLICQAGIYRLPRMRKTTRSFSRNWTT